MATKQEVMNGEVNAIDSEVNTVDGEVKTMDGEVKTMDGKVNTTKGEVNTTKGEISTTRDEIRTTKDEISTTDSETNMINSNANKIEGEENTVVDECLNDVSAKLLQQQEHVLKVNKGGATIGEQDDAKHRTTNEEPVPRIKMKNENLGNELSLSYQRESNSGMVLNHTAVLELLQQRLILLESNKDPEMITLIEKLHQEHEREIEVFKRASGENSSQDAQHGSEEVSKVNEKHENVVKQLRIEHERQIEELRTTLEQSYNKQVLKISDELRDHYQNDIDEKITKLEEDWELEFTKQKMENDERVSAVQKEQWAQCQEAIERVTLDAEDQLKNMTHSHERETAEYRRRIHELLEKQALSEVKEKELDEEKSQKENEQFEKIKSLEKQLSDEKMEVETQVNGAQSEIRKLKEEHERQMANLKAELEKKYSIILNETRDDMKRKYQDELDEKVHRVETHLREQYEQDLEKTKEELRESSRTLKTKYEKQLSEVMNELEELHEKNQQHELEKSKLKKDYESTKKKVKGPDEVHNHENSSLGKELQNEKLSKCLDEKRAIEEQLDDLSSKLTLLQKNAERHDKEKKDLQSKYETDILEIKSIHKEQLTKLEQQNTSITEKEANIADQEATITKLQATVAELEATLTDKEATITERESIITREKATIKDRETTISKLQSIIIDREATIVDLQENVSELEKTSHARELEIANLVLLSPVPNENVEDENEFMFTGKPEERVKKLEIEVAKYKKKVKELEEEAEDKFETTMCQKCENGETREEIVAKAKVLVEKIENDCKETVEDLTRKLEINEEKLKQQSQVSQDLEEKLKEVERELRKERETKELSKLNKHVDINHNLLHDADDGKPMVNEEGAGSQVEDYGSVGNKNISDGNRKHECADCIGIKREYEKLQERRKTEISEKDLTISERDREISEKDHELSRLVKEKATTDHSVERLKEKLSEEERRLEQLAERARNQKTNYESEIQLMQKEIETLIQEIKKQENRGKLADEYQGENTSLQVRIRDLEKNMADSSVTHQEEIVSLQEIIQTKESSLEQLRRMHQSLEASSKEIDTNIENLKKNFEEKEKQLLNEIQERTAMFEEEKNEILENSFHEKEGLLTRINDLERLCKKSDIWLKNDEQSGNSNHRRFYSKASDSTKDIWGRDQEEDLRSMGGLNRMSNDDYKTQGTMQDQVEYHALINGISEDNPRNEEHCSVNEGCNWPISDKNGERFLWTEDTQDSREYDVSSEDEKDHEEDDRLEALGERENRLYDNSLDSDLENERRELEIELLVEKEEKERLRRELGTITKCVDVFHDECKHLKSSLDNALDMLEIMKEERDALAKQSDRNLEENSEIMLDLIKYEEIIRKLELGNEKLVQERKILMQCLRQLDPKQSYPRIEYEQQYSTKSNPEDQTELSRSKNPVDGGTKFNSDIQEIELLMGPFKKELESRDVRKSELATRGVGENGLGTRRARGNELPTRDVHGNELATRGVRGNGLATGDVRGNRLGARGARENKLEASVVGDNEQEPKDTGKNHRNLDFREDYGRVQTDPLSHAPNDKYWRKAERNEKTRQGSVSEKSSSFLQTGLTQYELSRPATSYPGKTSEKPGNEIPNILFLHLDHEEGQRNAIERVQYGQRGYRIPCKVYPRPQPVIGSFKHDTQKPKPSPWSPQELRGTNTSRGCVMFTRDDLDTTTDWQHDTATAQSKRTAAERANNAQINRGHFLGNAPQQQRLPGGPFHRTNSEKRTSVATANESKISNLSPQNTLRLVKATSKKPSTRRTQKYKDTSNSFLTSTKTDSRLKLRLTPDLSGLSPIVSEIERRRHEEMKGKMKDDDPLGDWSLDFLADDGTTVLTTADPFGRHHSRRTPTTERFYTTFSNTKKRTARKKINTHVRSRSADGWLVAPPNKAASPESIRNPYMEIPLSINFEDFVVRHRVRSSEDVASLRDPSPAELWFS